MGNIADITEELAIDLHTAIVRHKVDFAEGVIPENPASRYSRVNDLLYGTPLLSHNKKGIINFCNYEAAKIFGRTVEQMLDTPSVELAPDVDNIREERARALDESLRQTKPLDLTNERRWQWQADGSKRQILIDACLFPYEHQDFKSHAASIRFKGDYQP
ncbi:PAS domain-containing protein [Candidatus Woesearchaeota archaeon]|nr:PAS domain-containing protein [Candidatus Woesearchaeota archaeon]